MENKIKIGDTVTIKNKSQRLLITAWSSTGNAICLWHTRECGYQSIEVDPELLVKINIETDQTPDLLFVG